MSDWLYSDTVKDHFTNPRNVLFENEADFAPDAKGQTGNIKCGDQMLMLLKIKDDVITVKYAEMLNSDGTIFANTTFHFPYHNFTLSGGEDEFLLQSLAVCRVLKFTALC